jgi:ribonuclease HI
MSNKVYLYVDGSCRGNPGPGGYAAILQYGRHERHIVGSEARTTNNRMELTAVIAGLKVLKRRCQILVITDSQYVATVLNGGRAKANLDLVQELHQLTSQHAVQIQKVNGHSGHAPSASSAQAMNERADRLAYAEATKRLSQMEVASV